jgi:5-formyltetrahydrofolate cyclo-ligase
MTRRRERIKTVMTIGNLACSRVAPCERAAVRQQLLAARDALSVRDRATADVAVIGRLDAMVIQAQAQRLIPSSEPVLGVYWPVRAEPDLSVWYAQVRLRGWRLALPQTIAHQPLEFGLWQPSSHLVNGPWQIPLPDPFIAVEPDLLIVPCLGFDARGWRLGYGGGFYDRTLAVQPIPAIGVARSLGQIGELVPETHDIALDAIVTEGAVFRASTDHDDG